MPKYSKVKQERFHHVNLYQNFVHKIQFYKLVFNFSKPSSKQSVVNSNLISLKKKTQKTKTKHTMDGKQSIDLTVSSETYLSGSKSTDFIKPKGSSSELEAQNKGL